MTARRERLLWALVFSVPPAAGVALATAKVGPRTLVAPIVGGAFVVVAAALFALVYGAVSVGGNRPNPDADDDALETALTEEVETTTADDVEATPMADGDDAAATGE